MIPSHRTPGRRLAKGSYRADHLLALFGFSAHALLFFGLGALCCLLWPGAGVWLTAAALGAAGGLLVVRAAQVGLSTTRESMAAIRQAWLE